jgi:hypothetical protein
MGSISASGRRQIEQDVVLFLASCRRVIMSDYWMDVPQRLYLLV